MKQSIKNYLKNIALAAGQTVNTIAAGSPHETVSSRIYRCAVLADSPTIAATPNTPCGVGTGTS